MEVSMRPEWIFYPLTDTEKERDSQAGEFYRENILENLVRESIQNSLDARCSQEPVRVRFTWGRVPRNNHELQGLFRGFESHYEAWQNEVRKQGSNSPTSRGQTQELHYLAVEDFETTGLNGSLKKDANPRGRKNDLYDFFMREGISEKGEESRGRRGLGKQVFLSISDRRCCFAWTIREDVPQSLMMGMCVLGNHTEDQERYRGDGWYAIRNLDGTFEPITDASIINRFCQLFNLKRQSHKRGLSVVSPFVNEECFREIDTTWKLPYLVIKEYFYAILNGSLVVELDPPKGSKVKELPIDASFLRDPMGLKLLFDNLQDEEECEPQSRYVLKEHISLTTEYLTAEKDRERGEERFSSLTIDARRWGKLDWMEYEPDENMKKEVRDFFLKGRPILIRVFLNNVPGKQKDDWGRFDVILKRSDCATGKATFIRKELIISDVHERKRKGEALRKAIAIVIIRDGPLSDFLGDAENPSHTKWEFTDRFRPEEEPEVKRLIAFVTKAPQVLAEHFTKTDIDERTHPFQDLFSYRIREKSRTSRPVARVQKETSEETSVMTAPMEDVGPQDLSPFEVRKIRMDNGDGGFQVKGERYFDGREISRAQIRAAYRTRAASDPLKSYKPTDFDFSDKEQFGIEHHGCRIEKCSGNLIEFIPEKKNFKLTVHGFDPKRDVHCKVVAYFNDEG